MKEKKDRLSVREKNFCIFYLHYGNAFEAAAHAGYSQPEKAGLSLLSRDAILKEIEDLYKRRSDRLVRNAVSGYERLAFGSVDGAVRLLFSEDPLAELERGCSLFNVAEIKRPKDGALEIKFFDRLKALEKLEGFSTGDQHGTADFYRAVIGGIRDVQGRELNEGQAEE